MMELIFHDGKKSCVGDQKLRDWIKWLFSPYFFKNYKAKFSTNLTLKKKTTKIILEGKKPLRKNVVAIDNILWEKLQCFLQ